MKPGHKAKFVKKFCEADPALAVELVKPVVMTTTATSVPVQGIIATPEVPVKVAGGGTKWSSGLFDCMDDPGGCE